MKFGKLTRVMHGMNYTQSNVDNMMFLQFNPEGKQMILIVYVDDIIITGDDAEVINKLGQNLSKLFDVKDLGKLRYFLGIEVAYSQQGIALSQHKYILDLLKETGKVLSKPVATPVDCYVKLDSGEKSAPVNREAFQRLVGKLIYLNHTRPNIAYAVNSLSQFMNDPREIHLQAAYRVLAYLKGMIGQGILMSKEGSVTLEMYSDADFVGSVTDS